MLFNTFIRPKNMALFIILGSFLLLIYPAADACSPVFAKSSTWPSIREIVIFGDSLSDNGLSGYPGAEDHYGFRRFSTGPVWSEYLPELLGISKENTHNYAHAGALSGRGNKRGQTWSGQQWQVDQFLDDVNKTIRPATTLLAVQAAGGNDFFTGQLNATIIAENVLASIKTLIESGGRYFLILNLPNAGAVPAVKNKTPREKAGLSYLTTTVNSLISQGINDIKNKRSNVIFALADVQAKTNELLKSGAYIDDVYDYRKNTTVPHEDVKRYFWFDGMHPSTFVHFKIAKLAQESLEQVGILV